MRLPPPKAPPIEPLEAEEIFLKAASQTAENRNSMLCDLTAGRTTEIDYLNGYVARIGKEQDLFRPDERRRDSPV